MLSNMALDLAISLVPKDSAQGRMLTALVCAYMWIDMEDADREKVCLEELSKAIEQSRYIIQLNNDWDDEGSPAYKISTWERATTLLRRSAQHLWQAYHVTLATPKILPGPAGSIDLHWQTAMRELLINIPEILDDPINFYGDDAVSGGHDIVKGIMDLSQNYLGLFVWLMQP